MRFLYFFFDQLFNTKPPIPKSDDVFPFLSKRTKGEKSCLK